MTKQTIQVAIESFSHDGRGIAHHEGKILFVDDALPGETVVVQLTRKRRQYAEAKKISVIVAAADRIEPRCEHFDLCGGCSLQHMSADKQLEVKQAALLEQLAHFGGVSAHTILNPIEGPHWHYRRKARLSVRYVAKRKATLVGFREKNGRFVADINFCHVLDESVASLIPILKIFIHQLDCFAYIPQIEVAVGQSSQGKAVALVVRHLEPLTQSDELALKKFAEDNSVYIYLQPAGIHSVYQFWPKEEDDYLFYELSEYDLRFYFHPLDFVQINETINQTLLNTAIELLSLDKADRVLDLFCGIGNFTLPLATQAGLVTGVEGSRDLVERAGKNAESNRLDNVSFYVGDLHQLTEENNQWWNEKYDKILLDPPRSGAREIVEKISRFNAGRIVYVSCNPATLARDAAILIQQGYQLDKVGIVDMFPHTKHVEAIALFVK